MKTSIILLATLTGYFLPGNNFSLELFLIVILLTGVIGYVFPEMMNANSLRNKTDKEKVTFKNKISVYKMNTVSLWSGVFVFVLAVTSLIKHLLLNFEINQTGIIILAFSLGVFMKLYNINESIYRLVKR